MDKLCANFDLEKIIPCLENGKIEKFSRYRFYADEEDAVKILIVQGKDTPKKFCAILSVNYEKFTDLAEEIFLRRERLERLKTIAR